MAMALLEWSQSEQVALIPLNANRFLTMMSQLAIGWLLLDAALLSEQAAKSLPESHPDRAFYQGKRASAVCSARNVLPGIATATLSTLFKDTSAIDRPGAGLGTT